MTDEPKSAAARSPVGAAAQYSVKRLGYLIEDGRRGLLTAVGVHALAFDAAAALRVVEAARERQDASEAYQAEQDETKFVAGADRLAKAIEALDAALAEWED